MLVKKISQFLFILFFFSCFSQSEKNRNYITLLMRSPYGCSHSIKIAKDGNVSVIGGYENNYREEFTQINKILKTQSFIINKKKIDSLKSIVSLINQNNLEETIFVRDGMHYELYIENVKKIDAYARKSNLMNKMKDYIISLIPKKIDYFCDSYN